VVIDHRHQGSGYGRATMLALIARIQSEAPDCRMIGLSCKPGNIIAQCLYRSLGFELAETNSRGGIDMWLDLSGM